MIETVTCVLEQDPAIMRIFRNTKSQLVYFQACNDQKHELVLSCVRQCRDELVRSAKNRCLLIIQALDYHLIKSQESLFPMYIETQESGQVLDRIVFLF